MTATKPLTDAERAELREIGAAHDEDLFALLDERDRLAAETGRLRTRAETVEDDLLSRVEIRTSERDAARAEVERLRKRLDAVRALEITADVTEMARRIREALRWV